MTTLNPTDTYQAKCSCGWASEVFAHMKPAVMRAVWHDQDARLLRLEPGKRHTIHTGPVYEVAS